MNPCTCGIAKPADENEYPSMEIFDKGRLRHLMFRCVNVYAKLVGADLD